MSVREALADGEARLKAGDHVGAALSAARILSRMPRHSGAARLMKAAEARARAAGPPVTDAEVTALIGALNAGAPRAAAVCADLIARAPGVAVLHNIDGILKINRGEATAARASFQAALTLDPRHREARDNLAQALLAAGDAEGATREARRVTTDHPGWAGGYLTLATVLRGDGATAPALAALDKAAALAPGNARIPLVRGHVLLDALDPRAAIDAFAAALAIEPENPEIGLACGFAHTVARNRGEAAARLRGASGLFAGARPRPTLVRAEAFRLLAQIEDLGAEAGAVGQAEGWARDTTLAGVLRAQAAFGLARTAERVADLDRARAFYVLGNGLRRDHRPVDAEAEEARLAEILRTDWAAQTLPADGFSPVFVLGMPRSGTTLVQQILTAAPALANVGELPFAPDYFLGRPGPHDAAGLAAHYRARLAERGIAGDGFVDKQTLNHRWIGPLAAAFPAARFVHVRRDLRDTAASIWRNYFNGRYYDFVWNAGDIADEAARYLRLMEHWRGCVRGLVDVDYEALVVDPAGEGARLFDALGLDWDDAYADPSRNPGAIVTNSVTQATATVHRGSVGSYRGFADDLAPVIARFPQGR